MDKSLIIDKVKTVLGEDNSGHNLDHVLRVYNLAMKFQKIEGGDEELIMLIALLHDVDDYKIVGKEEAKKLTNAKNIMNELGVIKEKQEKVLETLASFGYSNLLLGNRPTLKEGQIVSDADMCDASGVTGVLRSYAYAIKKGHPFFIKDVFPRENMTYEEYTRDSASDHAVCHQFEKTLKLKDLMFTKAGQEEALRRHKVVVELLQNVFIEEDAPEWIQYLKKRGF